MASVRAFTYVPSKPLPIFGSKLISQLQVVFTQIFSYALDAFIFVKAPDWGTCASADLQRSVSFFTGGKLATVLVFSKFLLFVGVCVDDALVKKFLCCGICVLPFLRLYVPHGFFSRMLAVFFCTFACSEL